jgi:hypothetical protein
MGAFLDILFAYTAENHHDQPVLKPLDTVGVLAIRP